MVVVRLSWVDNDEGVSLGSSEGTLVGIIDGVLLASSDGSSVGSTDKILEAHSDGVKVKI